MPIPPNLLFGIAAIHTENDDLGADNSAVNDGDENVPHGSPELLLQAADVNNMSPKSLLLSLALGPVVPSRDVITPKSIESSKAASPFKKTHPLVPAHLDPDEIVVGKYTRAQRAEKIARYREKRANRHYTKKIIYGVRKTFADARPRVGGRFVKMTPSSSTTPTSASSSKDEQMKDQSSSL